MARHPVGVSSCSLQAAPPIAIEISISRFETKEHEALRDYALSLNQMLGPLGLTKVEIIKLGGVAGQANSRQLKVWVPSLYLDPKLSGLKPVSSAKSQRPIFDHEFGHLVFDHNLILEISGVKASFDQHFQRIVSDPNHADKETLKRFTELREPSMNCSLIS